MILPISAFTFSLILAFLLVPFFSSLAGRVGLVDLPDNNRKLHKSAIPMVGGITVFVAALFVIPSLIFLFQDSIRFRPTDQSELTGLLVGAMILLIVGLADDLWNLRGRQKLLGQIIAITALIVSGYQFDSVTFAGFKIEFGIFSVLVIYAWMIAAINSINLLDGADGFASTIGIIMSMALAVMALYQGKVVDAVIALSLAGALLGFLNYNFPPAKAYLGDSGSMLIGYMLGAMAIRCTFKQATAYAFFAPVALLAIPFIDTGAAIIRRRLMGRSIYTVDRGHLHHRLMKQGYSPRVSLLWVALLCTMTAIGGILALINRQSEYAIASIIMVVLVLFFARIFGLAEFRLVSNRAISIGKSFMRTGNGDKQHVQSAVHVQGNRDWQELWEQICEFADEHEINQVTMDLNLPWMHESFHATRRRAGTKRDASREWYVQLPLVVDEKLFGRIEVLGAVDGRFTHHQIVFDMLKIAADIEHSLRDISTSAITNVGELEVKSNSDSVDDPDSLVSSS